MAERDKIVDTRGPRPFADLRASGLLWLINASVFHPRGLALGITYDEAGNALGWRLLGDSSEPWSFPDDKVTHRNYHAALETMARAVLENQVQASQAGIEAELLATLRNPMSVIEPSEDDAIPPDVS